MPACRMRRKLSMSSPAETTSSMASAASRPTIRPRAVGRRSVMALSAIAARLRPGCPSDDVDAEGAHRRGSGDQERGRDRERRRRTPARRRRTPVSRTAPGCHRSFAAPTRWSAARRTRCPSWRARDRARRRARASSMPSPRQVPEQPVAAAAQRHAHRRLAPPLPPRARAAG